jgi:hypothetical protein
VESIYYVMAWACHRRCRHCYEDRFRPYVRADLERVIAEAERNGPRIVANLPDRHIWLDRTGPEPVERGGRIILAGGESLLDGVRERVTYPTMERLAARYRGQGVKVVVQTTGDLLTPAIIRDLVDRGAWTISVAGVDDFHVGLEGPERQAAFKARLTSMFEAEGLSLAGRNAHERRAWFEEEGPLFSFFGATPDQWIGKLWPRGRAWINGLSTATLADNFCARWSGGMNFLRAGEAGSEVSVEPDGAVYPCCLKTAAPLGYLTEEPLDAILASLRDDPAFQAIDQGDPARMGLTDGWTEAEFLARCETTTPQGRAYANLCIGCDSFHADVLAPRLAAARARRLGAMAPC